MSKVALIVVTHDPNGKNIELFNELRVHIESNYSELFITISEESSTDIIETIKDSKFNIKIIPKNGAGAARREVVKFGLSGQSDYFHYCDFDRLLTWCKYYPNELKTIVSDIPKYDYLILGRTERAMNTHPIEWVETEKITNKICSIELGNVVDITAGSCSFSRKSAELINKFSKEKMTDAEWAMIAKRIGGYQVHYLPVEGLEYHEETNGLTRKISDSEKWFSRLRLSLIISESAIKTGLKA
ncbi:hypothetical protein [Robertmurraya kyonggiensis]|uniref:Glycosyltransferase 2-like domain-containing protein n=1 Tax=Robertmurraya kyonggiensis TaxID=1037680 RepID=A0A4U1DAH0_9BACI|nr:hypothetical protein [Robertmurraya kyonggiensis]TKC19023.1 hypothetical protein FA727_05615 [Robertmurraya kyonggiensis]